MQRRDFLRTTAALAMMASTWECSGASQQKKSAKKGLGIALKKNPQWREQLTKLNAQWFYTWGANLPEEVPTGIEYVPMIWKYYGKGTDETLATLQQQAQSNAVGTLLGFNEPDQHDQSNMTVEEALSYWPKLMETGLPLVSPGCVHPDREWMKEFMAQAKAKKYRVDYVAVHSYGGPNPQSLLSRLKSVSQMYERPLWITEFAVGDWNAKTVAANKHRPSQVAAFMKETLPMLEEADFVSRYAWFNSTPENSHLGTSALTDENGDLTIVGKIYAGA